MATKTAAPKAKAAAPKAKKVSFSLPGDADVLQMLEDAREAFYKDPNVIGVGVGERRKDEATHHDEIVLIVYVKEKVDTDDVKKGFLIPPEFQGIGTDVVAPFGPDQPRDALGFAEGHQHSDDMSFVDWPRLHEQWEAEAGGEIAWHGRVQNFGDVCVIQDDGTLVKTIGGRQQVDFVRAYKLFRTTHPDIYDFVTFFTDSAHGMPPQGGSSWYRFVHNDTRGIGLGNFNQRPSYGSNVLQGIMFLNEGHFGVWRYVMLQEQGHRWASFARYRDTATGPRKNDHMLGGWGHWTPNFDDDLSPMDYDTFDWEATNGNFRRVTHSSEERTFCNLDLYLMGLLGPHEVGDFYLLSGVTRISGNLYSATKKRLTSQNIVLAEGARNPSVATSQKLFKNAFVVLTGDMSKVHDYVDKVDFLRLRFEEDFAEASKNLAQVDTTLGPVQIALTPAQVRQLTSRRYTNLHRHIVRPNDLRITGTQFTSTLSPGQTRRWFTHSWPLAWHVDWSVIPTTVAGGGPKLRWNVQTERTTTGITYWITIRNVSSQPIAFRARYSITR